MANSRDRFREKDLARIIKAVSQDEAKRAIYKSDVFKTLLREDFLQEAVKSAEEIVDIAIDLLPTGRSTAFKVFFVSALKFLSGATQEFSLKSIENLFADLTDEEKIKYWRDLYDDAKDEIKTILKKYQNRRTSLISYLDQMATFESYDEFYFGGQAKDQAYQIWSDAFKTAERRARNVLLSEIQ